MDLSKPNILPSRLGLENTPTASLQRGKTSPPHNKCPVYDTKQSDGEVPVMLGLLGMQSTPSLQGPLHCKVHSGMVAPDRALSIG